MPILKLHDLNNPDEEKLLNTEEIASVSDFHGSSAVTLKSGVTQYFHESVEDIYNAIH